MLHFSKKLLNLMRLKLSAKFAGSAICMYSPFISLIITICVLSENLSGLITANIHHFFSSSLRTDEVSFWRITLYVIL